VISDEARDDQGATADDDSGEPARRRTTFTNHMPEALSVLGKGLWPW
jgi:hypothetical protein